MPGILAVAIVVIVRTVGMFELTYLVSGPGTGTLEVSIFRAMISHVLAPATTSEPSAHGGHTTSKFAIIIMSSCSRLWQCSTYFPRYPSKRRRISALPPLSRFTVSFHPWL